ncbi:MAG: AlpA family phage regulatory protein [Defluviicoccus sp.]|nr:AlpA family phage regulatory protein [Defluviicoccus sp.]
MNDITNAAPAARFMRLPKVCKYFGVSRSTVLRRVKAHDFPQPVKLGPNTIAWLADEVEAWAAAKIAARDGEKEAA